MNAADSSHALGPDLALLAPPSFAIKPGAQGLTGSEAGTGAALAILLKSTAAGSLGPDRLIESALALMQKKHAGAERVAAPESIEVSGCSGRTALLRASTPTNVPIHIALTTLIVPDPLNAAQQRNLIVILEIPTVQFDKNRAFYLGFAQQRLRIGAAQPAQPAPMVLELAPIAQPETPAPVAAQAAPPVRVETIPEKPPQPARTQTRKQPAAAAVAPAAVDEDVLLLSAAQGQKTLAISILLSFVARAIGNVPDVPVFLAYAIAAGVLIYAVSGVLKICSGFGYPMTAKLGLMFCSSVPLLGIACWVYLSIKTTRRLRAAGYQVGLFGVRA